MSIRPLGWRRQPQPTACVGITHARADPRRASNGEPETHCSGWITAHAHRSLLGSPPSKYDGLDDASASEVLTRAVKRPREALVVRLCTAAPQLYAAEDDDQYRYDKRHGADGGRHHRGDPWRCCGRLPAEGWAARRRSRNRNRTRWTWTRHVLDDPHTATLC